MSEAVQAIRAAVCDALSRSSSSGIGVFRAIVQALALPPGASALDIGCGVVAPTSTLGVLAALVPGRIVGLERDPARIGPPEELPGHVAIHHADAAYWRDGRFDLVCLDLDPRQIFESLSLIVETAPALLKVGGWVVARVPCRSRSGEKTLRDIPRAARLAVDRILAENFATLEPEPAALLEPIERRGYETVAVVPAWFARPWPVMLRRLLLRRWRRRAAALPSGYALPGLRGLSARSWLVLRRREEADADATCGGPAAYRLPRGDAFRLDEVVSWLAGIDREVCRFLQPAEYFARLEDGGSPPVSLLKHDIHHDLRRAVRMAAAEAERGVFGVYFMMGPSRVNQAYFDLPYTWEAIRRIRGMGHSIGYHLDVMDAIEQHGDLYRGLEAMLGKFAAEGIPIETANCHGNTSYRWANLQSYDFFRETCGGASRDNESFGRFVGAYSFAEIHERFGIRYWLDSQPNDAGRRKSGVVYVTDNSGALVAHLPSRKLSSARLDLDKAFQSEAAGIFGRASTLVLLHPQFYE